MESSIQYNAVNLFHQGSWVQMNAAWVRHRDWCAAWDEIKSSARIDPDREWERLERRGVRLVLAGDPNFPPLLREIHATPHALYVSGTFVFSPPTVAIVGTRRATREGLRIAHDFAHGLTDQGIGVISGLALGIDGAAHRGALASGKRPTVAVLPCGLDYTYPSAHTALARDIVSSGGAVISEYPFGTPALPFHFLERNRIVSGLSHGTLVVEAPARSGALVTARLATEQNRDVFVVPGPLNNPNYTGSHGLIRQGAALVTSPAEICEALGIAFITGQSAAEENDAERTPAERAVLSALRGAGTPLSLDAIAELGHLETSAAGSATAMLAVHGIIIDTNGLYSL